MTTSPRARFAEAADRLDRTIADLKARQYDAVGAKPLLQPAPAPLPAGLSPDEVWLKSYATHSIRLRRRDESAPPMPDFALPPRTERPRLPDRPPENVGEPVRAKGNPGHIGSALGKPAKKRGVLARLFRGRDA